MGDDDETTLRADPVQLARLAQSFLDSSVSFAGVVKQASKQAALPAGAFGNLASGPEAGRDYRELLRSGVSASGTMIDVLEVDNDSLLQVAFNYQAAECATCDEMRC